MGWTWRVEAAVLLSRYPSLANSQILMERWPAFSTAVAQMQADREPGGQRQEGSPTDPGAEGQT